MSLSKMHGLWFLFVILVVILIVNFIDFHLSCILRNILAIVLIFFDFTLHLIIVIFKLPQLIPAITP